MFIGTKVTVGAFVPDDYVAMYCWSNDIIAARLDGAFRPVNLKDVVSWCESAGKDSTRVMLSIRQRADPKIIGYLHIQNINAVHRSADIGIRIGEEKFRGQGYGKEALAIGLNYCWNHLNLERVGLCVFRHNQRAVNAYKAVGFKKEGLLRKLFFIDGAWVDVVAMAAFRPRRKRAVRSGTDIRATNAPVVIGDSAANLRPEAA
jgi:[ribosomal protein S5]-alanine N-acetyltransferase